jgi:hypothetical protein
VRAKFYGPFHTAPEALPDCCAWGTWYLYGPTTLTILALRLFSACLAWYGTNLNYTALGISHYAIVGRHSAVINSTAQYFGVPGFKFGLGP